MNPGRILCLAGCGALLATPLAARAERPQPTSESKSLHEWADFGFPVLDPPVLSDPISVGPIAFHPALSGSIPIMYFPVGRGSVDLTALLRSGGTTGSIDVSVSGYPAGDYTVSVVTESSSSTVVLGSLTVTSGSFPIWTGANPIADSVHAPGIIVFPGGGLSSGSAKFGGKRAPFPAGFNPFDIATLSLSDSTSAVVATTTLTPVPSGYYTALSPLVPGSAAPGATGYALIHADTPPIFQPVAQILKSGTGGIWSGPVPIVPPIIIDPLPPLNPTTGRLVIHAKGLPASTTVTYAADGADLGAATTDASGNLSIFAAQGEHRKLPSTLDLFSVQSVTVLDGSGNVLVSAGF